MQLSELSNDANETREPHFVMHGGLPILVAYRHDERRPERSGWGYCRADLQGVVALTVPPVNPERGWSPARTPYEAGLFLAFAAETNSNVEAAVRLAAWRRQQES